MVALVAPAELAVQRSQALAVRVGSAALLVTVARVVLALISFMLMVVLAEMPVLVDLAAPEVQRQAVSRVMVARLAIPALVEQVALAVSVAAVAAVAVSAAVAPVVTVAMAEMPVLVAPMATVVLAVMPFKVARVPMAVPEMLGLAPLPMAALAAQVVARASRALAAQQVRAA